MNAPFAYIDFALEHHHIPVCGANDEQTDKIDILASSMSEIADSLFNETEMAEGSHDREGPNLSPDTISAAAESA